MKEYVIHLTSSTYGDSSNEYGYWSGKCYVVQFNYFPLCDKDLILHTKRYKSRVRAEKMADKLLIKCSTVRSWTVVETDSEIK
ncbi:Uncharacterized protein PIL02S_03390 [Paenibacillus illinoisensis]|uniref:Uncharacterized protein n=1 Tax=Paenibacillus illinoisensis TaxID=59845 RepID=A0A2W0C8B4_9BACL|nr:Uncharacterized protein PIL02S_03390 [Paenibacillus illinoisensis]